MDRVTWQSGCRPTGSDRNGDGRSLGIPAKSTESAAHRISDQLHDAVPQTAAPTRRTQHLRPFVIAP